MATFGYCRISRKEQNIERQIRNISGEYPTAHIYKEAFTGTANVNERPELTKLLKAVKAGDTIVFDSVSRMSRNAEDGLKLYDELMAKGIELVFLKEHYIDTATYKSAQQTVDMTGNEAIDAILEGVNKALAILRKQQIAQAFAQAEKEVTDLRQRTREGLQTAKGKGKQIGQLQGRKLHVKKEAPAKEIIREHSKAFGGTLSDEKCMKLAEISRNTFYKYKKALLEAR